jgi:LysR family nitrogen assimilation transcriptional regulator
MDLSQLKTFMLVAELHSFTAAAKRQNYSQSAVSQQIRELEHSLGTKLFERHPRSVDLTPAGEVLLAHAATILEAVDAAGNALQDVSTGPQGLCRVGAAATVAGYMLAPAVARLVKGWPGLRLRVETGSDKELLDAFNDGDLDLVILAESPSPLKARGREPMPCFEEQVVPVACPAFARRHGQRILPLALQGLPVVAWIHGSVQWKKLVAELAALGVSPLELRTVFESRHVEALKYMIATDMGMGFLPASACARELADGSLVSLEIPGFRGVVPHAMLHADTQLAKTVASALARAPVHQLAG